MMTYKAILQGGHHDSLRLRIGEKVDVIELEDKRDTLLCVSSSPDPIDDISFSQYRFSHERPDGVLVYEHLNNTG